MDYNEATEAKRSYDLDDAHDALTGILSGEVNVGRVPVVTLCKVVVDQIPERLAKLEQQASILRQTERDILSLIVDPRDSEKGQAPKSVFSELGNAR